MKDVAVAALAASRDRVPLALARVVRIQGFGSRRLGQAALFSRSGPAYGGLLGGAADEAITAVAATTPACELVEVRVEDDPAVRAGLACGGSASVIVQDVTLVPTAWWDALLRREPAALVTSLGDGHSRVVTVGAPDGGPAGERLRQARTGTEIVGDELIEVWWPTPRLVVVGAADLAGALARQAELLGWEPDLVSGADGSERAAAALGPADGIVVLSHDHDLATPVLSTALRGRAGYVGALGSRHTQAERRARLEGAGLARAELARLHGPVGLDLGPRSPEEQALAICAEMLMTRSGRDGGALRDATGPINR